VDPASAPATASPRASVTDVYAQRIVPQRTHLDFDGVSYDISFNTTALTAVDYRRLLGCVLVSHMPELGLDTALELLWTEYEFQTEPASAPRISPAVPDVVGRVGAPVEWELPDIS
jgi:hypothetical protein